MKKALVLLFICGQLIAQDKTIFTNLTLQNCIDLAYSRNQEIRIAKLEEQQAIINKRTSSEIPKASVLYTQGQFNSIYKFDNSVTVTQTIPFPSAFGANKQLANASIEQSQYKTKATEADVIYRVKLAYFSLQHHYAIKALLLKEDSIYKVFVDGEKEKFKQGKASVLEISISENKTFEIANLKYENEEAIVNHKSELQRLLQTSESLTIKREELKPLWINYETDSTTLAKHPYLLFYNKQIDVVYKTKRSEKNKMFPDLTFGYTNLSIYGPANIGTGEYFLNTSRRLSVIGAGLNFQLWIRPYKAKLQSLELQKDITNSIYESQLMVFKSELDQNMKLYKLYEEGINAFDKATSTNYQEIIRETFESFKKGEISNVDYLTIVSTALSTETHHIQAIHQNNLAYLRINYLMQK
jgi:cobalt-zinc-cadmium resistance protein CzcA